MNHKLTSMKHWAETIFPGTSAFTKLDLCGKKTYILDSVKLVLKPSFKKRPVSLWEQH